MVTSGSSEFTAFVIMPFGTGFDEIYQDFIRDVLASEGFQVTRADDVMSSDNIMRSVITNIENSCLIVADLTDSNPNVYYELALAHAMHKPVITLTQDIEEIPFDIAAYRVIQYGRDFTMMAVARRHLEATVRGVRSGATQFGNPYSDYMGKHIEPECAPSAEVVERDLEGGHEAIGSLEHQARMEEGFEKLAGNISSIGSRTVQMSERTDNVVERMRVLLNPENRRSDKARAQRALVMELAREFSDYAAFLSTENDEFESGIEFTRPALEATLRRLKPKSREDLQSLEELIGTVNDVENTMSTFKESTTSAASNIDKIPHIERTFTRAKNSVAQQIRRLTGNVDLSISMLSRAQEIAVEMKSQMNPGGEPTA